MTYDASERELLPHEQQAYDDLPRLPAAVLHVRRERVFLVLSGLFLGTLAMLNILGVTRFIDLSFRLPWVGWTVPMPLAVGVLPYPLTFLCTDFLSEIYGHRRANAVVWMGLLLNLWVAFILWLGGVLPVVGGDAHDVFSQVRALAFAAISASMIAYLVAQLVDVQIFHFWRRRTRGRHLWLRNNGSTLVSQLVDTIAVILITHYLTDGLPIDREASVASQLATYILSGYVFKLVAALVDTGPFYIGTRWLVRFLRLPPPGEDLDLVAS